MPKTKRKQQARIAPDDLPTAASGLIPNDPHGRTYADLDVWYRDHGTTLAIEAAKVIGQLKIGQPKIGRPARSKAAATVTLTFRVTEAEHARIAKRAGTAPMAVYLRNLALGIADGVTEGIAVTNATRTDDQIKRLSMAGDIDLDTACVAIGLRAPKRGDSQAAARGRCVRAARARLQ